MGLFRLFPPSSFPPVLLQSCANLRNSHAVKELKVGHRDLTKPLHQLSRPHKITPNLTTITKQLSPRLMSQPFPTATVGIMYWVLADEYTYARPRWARWVGEVRGIGEDVASLTPLIAGRGRAGRLLPV